MLHHKPTRKVREVSIFTAIIEYIYVFVIGIIIAIVCSCFWKYVNNFFAFDHTSYGVNLIQYCVVKLSRFMEHNFLHINSWMDIMKTVYCLVAYYLFPIFMTSQLCRVYQSIINDCKSHGCKVIGMIIITLTLLTFCIFLFLDMIYVLRVMQETEFKLGYILTTMVN